MTAYNAFVTPEYPVLFTLRQEERTEPWTASPAPGESGDAGGGPGVAISIALLVKGMPSFLTTCIVPDDELVDVVESLEGGDARVAVVGISVTIREGTDGGEATVIPREEGGEGEPLEGEVNRPAAFVSLICADGRRISVARILDAAGRRSPEELAKHVIKEISRGVQVPDLASTP